jgi:hypothetical protein
MDDIFAQTEAQYCPPLDPALVSAILSDYDLADADNLASAKQTLDELKEDAILNEAAEFDPSGTGAIDATIDGDRTGSRVGTSGSHSRETDSTSLTNSVSLLDLDDDYPDFDVDNDDQYQVQDFEELDEAAKVKCLQGIFKTVSRYSIQHTLRKYNGKWNATVDELLSQASFVDVGDGDNEDFVVAKGIDGFTDDRLLHRGRRRKAKNKRTKNVVERRSSSLPGLAEVNNVETRNTWNTATEEIGFVAARMGMSTASVSSIYYANGTSMSHTIAAILRSVIKDKLDTNVGDATVSAQAAELAREFPTISNAYLEALLKVTNSSLDTARELARALTSKSSSDGGGIHILPSFAPLGDVDMGAKWNEATRKAKSAASSRSPSLDVASSATRRDTYAHAQALAFSKAGAAHRKAKSDRLMGGAAAYYGQLGREYAALSSSAAAETADRLVASQSTTNELDLHGVDVVNAVRIAQEKVEAWWEGLGESRVNGRVGAEDRLAGYRIVVGLGRHSEGGRSRLGPAVTKMLKQEGWRFESTGPVITVKGPAKR